MSASLYYMIWIYMKKTLARDHSFSSFAKFFRTGAYQVVRNISFSENFANLLDE